MRLRSREITESELLDECRQALLSHPRVLAVKRNNGGGWEKRGQWTYAYHLWLRLVGGWRHTSKGWPDLEVYYRAGEQIGEVRHLLIEIKRRGAGLSLEQEWVAEWAKRWNWQWRIIDRPDHIAELLNEISHA